MYITNIVRISFSSKTKSEKSDVVSNHRPEGGYDSHIVVLRMQSVPIDHVSHESFASISPALHHLNVLLEANREIRVP